MQLPLLLLGGYPESITGLESKRLDLPLTAARVRSWSDLQAGCVAHEIGWSLQKGGNPLVALELSAMHRQDLSKMGLKLPGSRDTQETQIDRLVQGTALHSHFEQ